MKRALEIKDVAVFESASKRQLVEVSADGDTTMKGNYKFKILLPNGTSVGILIRNPDYKMQIGNFIGYIREEYGRAKQKLPSWSQKPQIRWKNKEFYLEDTTNDREIREEVLFRNFKPNECHILRLHDGSVSANTFENMWDITPDTDLIRELPEEYTFETALADLIDNSLQAVWANPEGSRRWISVDISDDKISIFDTGPGMDGSDENGIVKWGKMGASLHRASKNKAIGGKPPYLMPFFGLFGYGGPIASMHLGRRCVVSSKTANSKVYVLHLEREELLRNSGSEYTWRTGGDIRNPSEDENARTKGSFTQVKIFEPRMKNVNISQLRCKLKDIYFPYIQCDEMSKSGKTNRPIEFQVEGVDLAEIYNSEVAVTNLHSSNGPNFVLQLHFSMSQSSGPRKAQEANARLTCVYFPIVQGKENIEKILEKLKEKGLRTDENFGSFSRVSIRRLGRLLPDARWACLPFMDPGPKRGGRALILKRCCKRVKCFIETDAGFNPTPSKTDLTQQSPFTTALRTLGRSPDANKEISVEIYREGKQLSLAQLEKEYHEWIFHMHSKYDGETDDGEDQPEYILNPTNKKALGISADVARVHKSMKRKGQLWRRGQNIKILKGACAGFHNNNVYGTIEYFLLEGFPDDAGGEGRIIFRPIEIPEGKGSNLVVSKGNRCLDINDSQSVQINVIDSGKLVDVANNEWNHQLDKRRDKGPSFIELLSLEDCEELNIRGVLPDGVSICAGQDPPEEIVAVLRPNNYSSSSASRSIDPRFIVKNSTKMSMLVKFSANVGKGKDRPIEALLHEEEVAPSSRKQVHGLYVFPLRSKIHRLFKKAGVYRFTFSTEETNCADCEKEVRVRASPEIHKWKLIDCEDNNSLSVTVGSSFPQLFIACYDRYENKTTFPRIPPKISVKLHMGTAVESISRMKAELSSNKSILNIKDLLLESRNLDMIRPAYSAKLVISSSNKSVPINIPFKLIPGDPQTISAEPPVLQDKLLSGSVIEELKLEVFDAYSNHVSNNVEFILNLEGLSIQDQHGPRRQVNDNGFIDLSGILKVEARHGEKVSLSVSSGGKVLYSFQLQAMEDPMPASPCQINGEPDTMINAENPALVPPIVVEPVTVMDAENRRPASPIDVKPARNIDTVNHSLHDKDLTPRTPKDYNTFLFTEPCINVDENQSQCSTGNNMLSKVESTPTTPMNDFSILSLLDNKELEHEICMVGERIGHDEKVLKLLSDKKIQISQSIMALDESSPLSMIMNLDSMFLREEIVDQIEKISPSAAASVLCQLPEQNSFADDIIGIVALLATVPSPDLSRILAKYLGEDQMLAIVCRSYETALCLEKYNENGEVDRAHALHAKAAELGTSIDKHFLVICLEDIRIYTGYIKRIGAQRLLALPDPTLPTGEMPQGFLGYAVNMINIVSDHLDTITSQGQGLRQTLFYQLFGDLQVYDTRRNMHESRFAIRNGAVSLDGGIRRENGFISLGCWQPKICFPVEVPEDQLYLTPASQEHAAQIQENKSEFFATLLSIGKVRRLHEDHKREFKEKSDKYKELLDLAEPFVKRLHGHSSMSSKKVGSFSILSLPDFVN